MNTGALAAQFAAQPAKELPKDAEGACRALEAQFTTLLLRRMREAMVPKSSTSSSFAMETTQGLLEEQWAALSSQGEGLGLWRTLLNQLEGAQPAVKPEPAGAEKKGMVALRPTDLLGSRAAGAEALSRTAPRRAAAAPSAEDDVTP